MLRVCQHRGRIIYMEQITVWLERKKVSRAEFARRIKADRSQVTRWLSGDQLPSLPVLRRISDVTGISIDKLARG